LQDLQIEKAGEEKADKELLGQLFTKHQVDKDGKKTVNNEAVLADLFSMGKADLALRFDEDRVRRETQQQQHETAVAQGDLAALGLEMKQTEYLSDLARGAQHLADVPEPLRQQGWEMFVKKAVAADPDLADSVPKAYDPAWVTQAVTAGIFAEQDLKIRAQAVKDKADSDFRAAIPTLEKQIKAAGRDEQRITALQRDIVTKYPNSTLAQEYVKGLPKSKEPKAAGDGDGEGFKSEAVLRKEFINQNSSYQQVGEAYGRIKASSKDPSAAGDLALIFNYMKMLDPGSVVREGEFATAQNAAGVPDRVRAQWNKAINGERLSEGTRKDFVTRANGLYRSAKDGYDRSKKTYSKLAKAYGVNPDRVIVDLSRSDDTEAPVAQPGDTVIRGGKEYTVGPDGDTLIPK
jgi:hypothetical protein